VEPFCLLFSEVAYQPTKSCVQSPTSSTSQISSTSLCTWLIIMPCGTQERFERFFDVQRFLVETYIFGIKCLLIEKSSIIGEKCSMIKQIKLLLRCISY